MYERYCQLREKRGEKDSDIAKALNITPSTFSDWKKGKSTPNAEKLLKLSRYFGVSMEYLLTGEDTGEDGTVLYFEMIYDKAVDYLEKKGCQIFNTDAPHSEAVIVETPEGLVINTTEGALVRNWEKFGTFDPSVEELTAEAPAPLPSPALTSEEFDLIQKYRSLSPEHQSAVKVSLEAFYKVDSERGDAFKEKEELQKSLIS